ncbi:unnamed protein product [Boreogadus saida]
MVALQRAGASQERPEPPARFDRPCDVTSASQPFEMWPRNLALGKSMRGLCSRVPADWSVQPRATAPSVPNPWLDPIPLAAGPPGTSPQHWGHCCLWLGTHGGPLNVSARCAVKQEANSRPHLTITTTSSLEQDQGQEGC